MRMPKWLRAKLVELATSVELDKAAAREKRWSERNIELSGLLDDAASEIAKLTRERNEANAALAREQRDHQSTHERLARLIRADRGLAAKRETDRRIQEEAADDLRRELHLARKHLDICPIWQAAQDHAEDKRRANA